MRYLWIPVLIGCGMAVAQKAPPKPFRAPEPIPMTNPLLAKDEGCAKDLAKSLELEGLALRKHAAELISYGCVRVPDGTYYVNITSVIPYKVGGKPLSLQKLHLIGFSGEKPEDGWVVGSQVVTFDAVEKAIRAAVKEAMTAEGKKQ